MERAPSDGSPQRLSYRALLGWGIAAGLVAAGGLGYALACLGASTPGVLSSSRLITDLCTYHGPTRAVSGLAWSPDGTRLASWSADKTVQVWDSATGQRLLTYVGQMQGPMSVAWSPDSTRLISAGAEGSLRVWQAVDG